MTDEQSKPGAETPKPAPEDGKTTKVDTEVQEVAAKEREESGGYD